MPSIISTETSPQLPKMVVNEHLTFKPRISSGKGRLCVPGIFRLQDVKASKLSMERKSEYLPADWV